MQAGVARWLSFSSLLGALGLCSAAGAADAPAALEWQAPPSCPGQKPVLEKLTELVGPEPLARSRYRGMRGEIRADSRLGWVLELELRDGDGSRKRTLSAKACDDLATAAAVALALVLDPEASLDGEWRAAEPPPLVPATPEPVAAASSVRDSGADEAARRAPGVLLRPRRALDDGDRGLRQVRAVQESSVRVHLRSL